MNKILALIAFSVLLLIPAGIQNSFAGAVDEANLSISKSDAPDPVVAGNSVTYTMTVSNAEPSDAIGVVVSDTLPPSVVFFATTGCAEDPNGVPTCSLGPIAAGSSAQYTIQIITTNPGSIGTIMNSASVSSDTPDPDNRDNTDSEDTIVTSQLPDIDIEKFVNGDDADSPTGPSLPVGSTATFTYIVTNPGIFPLQDVIVTDDAGTPSNSDDFNPTFTGGDTNNNGILDLSETWTYSATLTVTAGQHTNVATVTADGGGSTANNSDPANHFGVASGPMVGGSLIPIDMTMVLLAGTQMTAAWMIPVIVAGIGIAIVIARKF